MLITDQHIDDVDQHNDPCSQYHQHVVKRISCSAFVGSNWIRSLNVHISTAILGVNSPFCASCLGPQMQEVYNIKHI